MCSICGRSFRDLTKAVRFVIHGITSQPSPAFSMFSIDIFAYLNHVWLQYESGTFRPPGPFGSPSVCSCYLAFYTYGPSLTDFSCPHTVLDQREPQHILKGSNIIQQQPHIQWLNTSNSVQSRLQFLPLDEAAATRAIFVIVSGSDGGGWTDRPAGGRKLFWGQLTNNSKKR